MKYLLIIFSLLLTSVTWSKDLKLSDLVERDGLYYEKFNSKPFTGKVTGLNKGKIKNGKKDGEWFQYYKNGQLSWKSNYKNGKEDGDWLWYYENGQLEMKGSLKDGKQIGKWFSYLKNGDLTSTSIFKNGELIETIRH